MRRVVATTENHGIFSATVPTMAAKLSIGRVAQVLVDVLDLEAERGGEVLLVADHHVDVARPAGC